MDEPFIGQVILFGGNFAPNGWLACDGKTYPISQYETLFALIGTTYGGDGITNFAVPDLRGRVPAHFGAAPGLSSTIPGQFRGSETVTMTQANMPVHTHQAVTTVKIKVNTDPSKATELDPTGHYHCAAANDTYAASANGNMGSGGNYSGQLAPTGGSQPINIMQTSLAMTYCISAFGVWPPQN